MGPSMGGASEPRTVASASYGPSRYLPPSQLLQPVLALALPDCGASAERSRSVPASPSSLPGTSAFADPAASETPQDERLIDMNKDLEAYSDSASLYHRAGLPGRHGSRVAILWAKSSPWPGITGAPNAETDMATATFPFENTMYSIVYAENEPWAATSIVKTDPPSPTVKVDAALLMADASTGIGEAANPALMALMTQLEPKATTKSLACTGVASLALESYKRRTWPSITARSGPVTSLGYGATPSGLPGKHRLMSVPASPVGTSQPAAVWSGGSPKVVAPGTSPGCNIAARRTAADVAAAIVIVSSFNAVPSGRGTLSGWGRSPYL